MERITIHLNIFWMENMAASIQFVWETDLSVCIRHPLKMQMDKAHREIRPKPN